MTEKYNGHANYETWAVSLWINNDEGSQSYWEEQAADCWRCAKSSGCITRSDDARYSLSEALKESHQEAACAALSGEAGLMSDLLGAALSEVDWLEIADDLLRVAADEEDEDDGEDDEEEEGYIPLAD